MSLSFFSGGNTSGASSAVPFQRSNEPANLGAYATLDQADMLRIQRYNEAWRFFFGKQWGFRRDSGEPLVTINYFRKIIDKCVAFLVGKGFVVQTAEVMNQLTKPFLDEVWEYNKKEQFAWDCATMGAVTGDAYVLITFVEPTTIQQQINPFSQGKIRIQLLGSEQVFPTWDPLDMDTLLSVRIETLYYADDPQGVTGPPTSGVGSEVTAKRLTQIITPFQIIEQGHGEAPRIYPNPFGGEIPLVHIKNMSVPREYYGLPDGQDLIDLQREYNEKSTDISDTINYHACVDGSTEILTKSGWKHFEELREGEEVLGLEPESDEIIWQKVDCVNIYPHKEPLIRWSNRIDAVTTSNHRWLVERKIGRPENKRYERQFARTSERSMDEPAVEDLREGSRVIVGGGIPTQFPSRRAYDDEFVETVGWVITEGCVSTATTKNPVIILAQSETENSEFVSDIRRIQAYWREKGETFTEQRKRESGVVCWYLGTELTGIILDAAPNKCLTPSFLCALTHQQAVTLLRILIDADGTRSQEGREIWYQDNQDNIDAFQMLAAMVEGVRTHARVSILENGVVDIFRSRTIEILSTVKSATKVENHSGYVWCPTVRTGTWFARRNGYTYWTGNSPVTMIFGAKTKQLERGPRQIWAGLPERARVETLKLEGELTSAVNYLDRIKKSFHELSDIPEGSLGTMQPISNTSGVALHLQYQPLLEKMKKKRVQYEPGFEAINYFVLRIASIRGLISLPYDLCKTCGGRILEVPDPVQTKMVWKADVINPESQQLGAYVRVPVVKKRCYRIDTETMEFARPEDVRINFWRAYGFGHEIRQMPLKQIERELRNQKRSFWDYTVIQEELKKRFERINPPQPPPVDEQGREMNHDATPKDPKEDLPMAAKVEQLAVTDIDIPEEPEMVTVTKNWLHPETGELSFQEQNEMFLVPTGCQRPMYLNPYESKVELFDPLPKDEQLQAVLYQTWMAMGLVDAVWVRNKIPEIAADAHEIEKRMKHEANVQMQLGGTEGKEPGAKLNAVAGGEAGPRQFRQTNSVSTVLKKDK